ncbi:hypothetical protein LINPERHAP1_LOCUS512 [Linum perenne]
MSTPSIHSPSPSLQDPSMVSSSPPLFSPSSDKRYWSTLRGRIDSILENRHHQCDDEGGASEHTRQDIGGESMRKKIDAKRRKEDALLLLRGFDSISQTLSSLSGNIGHALQGARSLAEPPSLTELLHGKINSSDDESRQGRNDEEEGKTGLKRKFEAYESDDTSIGEGNNDETQNDKNSTNKLKKAKNLAVSMAKKAASMARELKSMKSNMRFVQERCALLEEENSRLRDGFSSGIRPEEDDLMRMQMEALLAEKSRLAMENANLKRENQCLHQLVEYHQLTSQDLSASYEQLVRGMGLDFSSPDCSDDGCVDNHGAHRTSLSELSTSLDKYFDEEL